MPYEIHLNFFPVISPIPPFVVHRKLRASLQEDRPAPGLTAHKLPQHIGDEADWQSYWVAPTPRPDFQPFTLAQDTNRDVTRRMLFISLCHSANIHLQQEEFLLPANEFIEEVWFPMERHEEGNELLVAQPYYLRATRQFGFLVDFHFRLAHGQPFTRRVQQLSLSLDRNFRRNLDYYADRITKIRRFLEARWPVMEHLSLPGADAAISFSKQFVALPADRLNSKTYLFAENRESRSQFSGLREHGPLAPTTSPLTLLFVFREEDRQAARRLAAALKGPREKFGFPGFKALFKVDLEINPDPVVLVDFSEASIKVALDRIMLQRPACPNIVPVIVLPDTEDNGYLTQKALFAHAEIPTQVCTLRVLLDEDTLKWAIANLALQIFCKAGGQPWKVRPTPERSLIIGISQSHKVRQVDGTAEIERYFAFSILLDNSGLFQEIHVLGESNTQTDYLAQLRTTLGQVLTTSAETFSRVVIHTSFKLKHAEMAAIGDTVRQVARDTQQHRCRFAVVKVNHRSRFFGVNNGVNSQVPFEATCVRLGPREYLLWFEGIFPDKTTVNKPFPGPTHVQFLHMTEDADIADHDLLQDLVNLSGANWRGFNAKSAPVSVFYCHLVADLVHDFYERGLPLPAVKDLRPWFL